MTDWRQLSTMVITGLLVTAAFASVPVAAQEERVAVETHSPTDVTTDAATLEGNLTALENASNATVWFEYWVEGDAANTTESSTLNASSTGPFSIDVDELEANTTYVVVAHASTDNATGIGSEVTFTTLPTEPLAVSTEEASDVTTTSATLKGELDELEGADTASVWFEYWVEGDRANNSTTSTIELDEPGSFSASIDDLQNDTDYVYVAHAATENTSAVGDEVSFTTDDEDELLVFTENPTDVTNRSATFHGELDDLGNASSATVWFEYWQQGDAENVTTTTNQTRDSPGSFSASVDGLESNTTYFVMAHAVTENDSDAGGAVSFSTEPDEQPLGVETDDASAITNTSATLNGELTGIGDAENATVWFEYWVEGDRANNSTTSGQILDEPGDFSRMVTGLKNETTYQYVAYARANGTTVTGEAVSFTTGEAIDDGNVSNRTWDGEEPFGRWLSGVIKNLVPPDSGTPLGQLVSEIVRENNPGNSAGPPEHAGPPSDDHRGPPEHAGPPDDHEESERGPPEHVGPTDEEEEEEDEES